MEAKKSKEADLERSKFSFFSIGLLVVSACILMAFTYKLADPEARNEVVQDNSMQAEIPEDFEMPEDEIEPEPEQAPPPPIIEEIEIVEDDEEIEEIDLGMDDIPEDPPEEVEEVVVEKEEIYEFAEVEPTFPGGEGAMMQWIQENIVYPQLSIEMQEQGIVYTQFVVSKTGKIESVKIIRGVSDALDTEAKRIVRKMPKWTPGEQAGKKVNVRYTLPIHFRLG